MQPLLSKLETQFPHLRFTAGTQFCWSPESQEVFYNPLASGDSAQWALLHETGHGLLKHTTYEADFQLLTLEVAAWEQACLLARDFDITIDQDHIQDCLDTYRDWLYQRSICPTCHNKCLQQDDHKHYRCFNCHTVWRVSSNRFARPYRRTKNLPAITIFK